LGQSGHPAASAPDVNLLMQVVYSLSTFISHLVSDLAALQLALRVQGLKRSRMVLVCSQTTHSSPRRCAGHRSSLRWCLSAPWYSELGPGLVISKLNSGLCVCCRLLSRPRCITPT
jgi:hypothetical protein